MSDDVLTDVRGGGGCSACVHYCLSTKPGWGLCVQGGLTRLAVEERSVGAVCGPDRRLFQQWMSLNREHGEYMKGPAVFAVVIAVLAFSTFAALVWL